VGFLPDDMKSGVILSEEEIFSNEFVLINQTTNEKVYSSKIQKSASN
jgi:hypothetical protein